MKKIKQGKKATNSEIDIYVDQVLGLMIQGHTTVEQIMKKISELNSMSQKRQEKAKWVEVDFDLTEEEKKEAASNPKWVPIEKQKRMIQDYMRRARERMAKLREGKIEEDIALASGRFELIYTRAMEKGKLKDALTANELRIKLLGLAAPKKVDATFKGTILDIPLSEEDWRDYAKRKADIFGQDFDESIYEEENEEDGE